MTDAPMPARPGFHLVDPSPWPIIAAGFALLTAIGLVMFMHGVGIGRFVLALGIAGVLFTMAAWWRDVILEAQHGFQNPLVRHGLSDRHDPVHRLGGDVLLRLVLGVLRLCDGRSARSTSDRAGWTSPEAYGRRRARKCSIRCVCR